MRYEKSRIATLATLLAAAVAGNAEAQISLTPRALGMGNAYVGVARGHETVFLNPANLGLPGTPQWSLAFPQLAIGGTLVGPEATDLPDIINFDDIEQERRQEILAEIPESGTELRVDFRAPLATLQSGRFALGVSYGVIGQHRVSRDLAELVFNGFEEGRTDYRVGNTRGSRISFWDFAAAYGRRIGPISLGVTGHYVRGGTVLNSRLFEPRINIEARDIEVDYRTVFSRGGQGYGLDVGLAFQPIPSVTVSAAVNNVVSEMEWSSELRTRSLTLTRADFDSAEPMFLEAEYEESEEVVDPTNTSLQVLTTAEGLFTDANFPAIGRIGVAWKGEKGTDVAASYQDKLSTGRLAGAWDQRLGIGVQQRVPVVTLRAGFASNLEGASMLTGGLTLGVLQLGLARLHEEEFPGEEERSGWVGTFGVSVRTKGMLQ